MHRLITKSRMTLLFAGLAVVMLGAVMGAACGDDDDGNTASPTQEASVLTQEEYQDLAAQASRAQVLGTATLIFVEELHDVSETAQTATEFEAGWSGSITRMRQAVQGTDWPEELEAGAEELLAQLAAAEAAIDAEDLAAFKTAAADSHSAWHGIEHGAFEFVAGEEISEGGGHDE